MKSTAQVLEDGEQQVVARILGRNVTRATLREAFDRVADKTNWKNPIDAEVVIESGDYEMETIREAVVFFAGCRPSFTFVRVVRRIGANDSGSNLYRVRAAGYYVAVGA